MAQDRCGGGEEETWVVQYGAGNRDEEKQSRTEKSNHENTKENESTNCHVISPR
jgi:hypothetical protein